MVKTLMWSIMLSVGQGSPPAQPQAQPTVLPGTVYQTQVLGQPLYTRTSMIMQEEKKNGDANGDNKEEEKKEDDGPWRLFPNEHAGFKITGWIYGSGVVNATNGRNTRYNGPLTMNDQEGVYLNQLWVNLSRPLKDTLDWGATFDFFYGNDYIPSGSRGWENARARGTLPKWNSNQDYGISIPQAYVEVGTTDYSLKVGHFYTPHGYMTVQPIGNFFNTLPFGFMMTNPFTHWGGTATGKISDNLSMMVGIVNGWDALDRPVNAAAFMGAVKYTIKEGEDTKGFLSVNVITGQEPENRGAAYANRTLFTTVFDYNFTENLEFVFEQNTGWQENRGIQTDWFYNFSPYLFYKLSKNLRAGIRYEYFRDPGGFVAGVRVGNPNNGPIAANVISGPYTGDFQTIAVGLNWAPSCSKNLMIRPEVRYDWFSGTGVGGYPFNAGQTGHQIVLMVGAYYQF